MKTLQKLQNLLLAWIIFCAIPIHTIDRAQNDKISRQIISSQPEDDQIENPAFPAESSCFSTVGTGASATIPPTPSTPPSHQRPAIISPGSTITFNDPATLSVTLSITTLTDGSTSEFQAGDTLAINASVVCDQGLQILSGNLVIYGDLTINGTFIMSLGTSLTVYGDLIATGLAGPSLSLVAIYSPLVVHGNLSCNNYTNTVPDIDFSQTTSIAVIIAAPVVADAITMNNNSATSNDVTNSNNSAVGVIVYAPITTDTLTLSNNSGAAHNTHISATTSAAGVAIGTFVTAETITIEGNSGTADTINKPADPSDPNGGFGVLIEAFMIADTIILSNNFAITTTGSQCFGLALNSIMAADTITMNCNYTTGSDTPIESAGLFVIRDSSLSANTITMNCNNTSTSSDANNIGLNIESSAINTNTFIHTSNSSESINA